MALDLLDASFSCREKLQHLFALVSEIVGKDMIALLRSCEPEILKRTDVSQPAITLANLAAATCLIENGIRPCGCAGFSLGEYTALVVAGVISVEDCFTLVTARGKAMQTATDRIKNNTDSTADEEAGMAAVIGLRPEKVEELIKKWKDTKNPVLQELYAANFNSPKQTVLSGSGKALAEAETLFTDTNADGFIRLEVAGPFHSPFMAQAAEEFRSVLEKAVFNDPVLPLYSNVSGKLISTGEQAKKMALLQITGAVRWTDEEAAIKAEAETEAAGGFDTCLEAGPGKVLQRLWRDSGSTIPCLPAGTAAAISKLISNG